MNYLAHFLLAGRDEAVLAGSLLGDFVKGPVSCDREAGVRVGILLHRRIDGYTDAHPRTRASRERFGPELRRYAGIVVDLAYDHFLARHWRRFCDTPLDAFAADVYRALGAHRQHFTGRAGWVADRMIEHDWLSAYRELDSLARAFVAISRRLSRPNPLPEAIHELRREYRPLESDFAAFFPELQEFARMAREELVADLDEASR